MKTIICEICKNECFIKGFNSHLRHKHNISIKDYYDKFFKKDGDDKCKVCKKDTKFKNFKEGYFKYCSVICANKDEDKIKKTKENNLKKYGVVSTLQEPNTLKKIKETYIRKYGVEHNSKSIINKEKIRETWRKKTKEELDIIKNKNSQRKTKLELYKKSLEKFLMEKHYTFIGRDNYVVTMKCDKGHIFNINQPTFRNREYYHKTIVCTICNPIKNDVSEKEKQLHDFIKENYNGKIIENSHDIISPLELDIYLPDLKLAFEFNGLFWHNELNKPKDYHKNKIEFCENKNIKLVHIYEDDWDYKQDIVKSRILNLLGKSKKIFARKCIIKLVDKNMSKDFLEKSHIQGYINSKINIGLFYNNELVSLMTFGKARFRNKGWELLRFCNKLNYTVVGGANRLFKYFLNNQKPDIVISYASRDWSVGNLYKQLGFKFDKITKPNYYYIVDGIRKNRFNFRKSELIKSGFNKTKTETEIMLERKIYKIFDSGNLKFVFNSLSERRE